MADMDNYFPFSAGAGSAASEGSWRKMARMWSNDGVDLMTSSTMANLNALQVYADSSGKQVKVRTGGCWVNGFYGETTSEKTIPIVDNNTGSTRVDRIVAQVDPSESSNKVTIEPVTGTASAPALTQSASGVWQVTLAKVTVANAFATVAAADVTDERAIARGINGSIGDRIRVYDNTLTATTASVDTGAVLPQTFRDLEVNIIVRSSAAVTAGVMRVLFNNDTSAVYDWNRAQETGTYTLPGTTANQTYARLGIVPGSSSPSGRFGSIRTYIPNYTSTAYGRNYESYSTLQNVADGAALERVWGVWAPTAINQLVFSLDSGSSIADSRFTVDVLR